MKTKNNENIFNKYFSTAILILLMAVLVFLSVLNPAAAAAAGSDDEEIYADGFLTASEISDDQLRYDGPGMVTALPRKLEIGKTADLTFVINFSSSADSIYEVQIKVPYNFRFNPSKDNVKLEGSGLSVADIKEISGAGYQNREYVIKIVGAAIKTDQPGQISLLNVTAPMYVASNKSPLNKFLISTRTMNSVISEVADNPIFETYNPGSVAPKFLINEVCPKNSANVDFIEIYCQNDGNSGNGIDLYNWQLTQFASSASDKTFGSIIMKTGNYLILKYNSSTGTDDIFPSYNTLNTYTSKTGINDTGFIIVMKAPDSNIYDALVCDSTSSTFDYNNVAYLVSKNHWNSLDKKGSVDISGLLTEYSVARYPGRADTNSKSDFAVMNYQTPLAPNGNLGVNAKILVNEFKTGSNNGDFIEYYVQDDGSGGGGTDIRGYEFSDGVDFTMVMPENTIIKTGEYILVNYGAGADSVSHTSGNVLNINTHVTGLSKVFGILTCRNSALSYLDAAAYSSGTLSEANRLSLKKFVDAGLILDMNPAGVYDELDCVSIKNMTLNSSYGRNDKSADTNSETDFTNFLKPTPGKPNIASGLPVYITSDPADKIYSNADSETAIEVRAIDIDGKIAPVSTVTIVVTSDSEGTKFSEDGINYSTKIETSLRYGVKKLFIKDSAPGSKYITIKDKYDDRLKYKLNYIVTGLFSVQINEIMYNQHSSIVKDPLDMQWIELYNSSKNVVDISNYKLKCGSYTYVFPENTKIEGMTYIVVASRLNKSSYREDSAFSDIYGNADGEWTSRDGFIALDSGTFRIGKSSGRIAFTTPDDVELSVVNYVSAQGGNGNKKSLEKANQNVYSVGENDIDRYNFVESGTDLGTPGKLNSKNSYASSKVKITHVPVTSASLHSAITIHSMIEGITSAEIGYRNSRVSGVYTYIPMVKIDNTNVYRTIIPANDVTLDGVDYYIRANNSAASSVNYSPDSGDTNPYKINVYDQRARISLTTPVKGVAPNESFYVDVNIENASSISNLSFDLKYNTAYFTVEDLDSAREGTQIAVGSLFSNYFNEVNEAKQSEGVISFKLVDQSGSVSGAGQVARIKFKTVSNYGAAYSEYADLKFENVIVSGSPEVNYFDNKVKLGDKSEAVVGISGGVVGGENQAKLVIPAGSVKTDTSFTIKKMLKSEIPATNVIDNLNGINSLDVAYEILPHGTKFQKPVTVEIPYTRADLTAAGVADEKNLKIYYYNTEKLAYEKVGGTVSNGKVTAKINHLSIFLLVEDQSKEEFDLNTIFVSPNPFSPNGNGWNDSTFINYTLTVDANITIKIFDVRGVLVRKLITNEAVSGGQNKAEWDGKNDFGKIVKTGVYIYQLKVVSPQKSSKTYQGTIVVSVNLKD